MKDGLQHISKRKRHHNHRKKLEPYPSKKPFHKYLDYFILGVATISPAVNIPQIIKIWTAQTAAGVSILTFATFAVFDIPWIIYGIIHKDKPIIISFSLWFITNVAVVASAIRFGF